MHAPRQPVPAIVRDKRFAARLYPHRSLSRAGGRWLIGLAAIPVLAGCAVQMALGAWPVAGFLGLDFVALWLALRLNFRSGLAFEEVAVDPRAVVLRKYSPSGRMREHRFATPLARFRVERHDAIGVVRMALAERGREVSLGQFLNPPDRLTFTRAFSAALAAARQ
jgi:uncharacterized membrane protein